MSAFITGQLPLAPSTQAPASPSAGTYDPALRVTALGGGHGLSATLRALRLIAGEITAVVTVADDGGSSGRIRQEMDVLPPGDLRMALAALCDDTDWGRTWRDVMQHRFRSREGVDGTLDNHALGNLLIVALWELLGDAVGGLRWAGALLGARGQVLPMSTVPLTISGVVLAEGAGGGLVRRTIVGQSSLAAVGRDCRVSQVRLEPADAPACPESLEAIELSDWIVLGPGSWYTSVLPHLLLPEMRRALERTAARRALVMNLTTDTAETSGMSAADHLEVVHHHAPDLRLDVVIADPAAVQDRVGFEEAAARLGASVLFSTVGAGHGTGVHDPLRLALAFQEAFKRP
ncbi:uridine diphosphate-N-acetylglucosamine-binding protein YvcK [Citricoccus sp. SGAir0253]|uniref:gluconeogenesis factor YvcK family protein n=1 Tax=Citricoccus sp. SGAir0253 TaxID=2567881 RepID=UPI0010CD4EB8|nr:uridine diphosphate-N-acetylglucosamine-binding protein YvcK [Citricoccus sp. SGAir0253]QCU78124.1 uridine diphosphate-N-acetylglucosamine-binding protein YvcK [Citricoccus sp. SGAir0253]